MNRGMQINLNACAINQKVHGCDDIAAKHPEIKDSIVSCEPKKFCEQQTYSAVDEALACWNGIKGSVTDFTDMFVHAWEKIRSDRDKRAAFVAACEPSIECKRDLVKDFPFHAKLTDAELNKYSTDQLLRMVEGREIAKQYPYGNYLSGGNSSATAYKTDPNEGLRKMRDLWNTAGRIANEKYNRYSCFTPAAKKELKCYIFSSLIDPTMVAGKSVQLVRARLLVAAAIEGEKSAVALSARELVETTTKQGLSKEAFTRKFLNYSPTTQEQNLRWIALAEESPKNVKFFDVENSVMKNLNDSLKDKNLVTSLTNYHKAILQSKTEKLMAELKSQFPDLELVSYSDFKSSRFAFKGQGPPDLQQRLDQILKETNQDFSDYITKNKFANTSDQSDQWFRAGYGETADQASLAARFSRQSSENSVQSYTSSQMKTAMGQKLQNTNALRTQLQSEVGHTSLMEGSGKKILSSDAIDILRKNGNDLAKSQADLKNRFGLSELSTNTVERMQTYVRSVDEFAPSLHIAQREVSHLDEAVYGGLSADMTGMGSKNLSATAKALSESKNLDEALVQTRIAERQITEKFNKQKNAFQEAVQDVVGKNRIKTVCSGDDCTAIPMQALSEAEKEKILQRLTDRGYSSEFRIAFIPERVADTNARTLLAVHGESVEKELRKNLASKMEPAKLKGVVFAVDMKTTQLGTGPVKLITATSSEVKLTATEEKLISESFEKALDQVNKDIAIDAIYGAYRAWRH